MTEKFTFRNAPLIKFILLAAFVCFSWQSNAQCIATTAFSSGDVIPADGTAVQVTSCNYSGEYTEFSTTVAGDFEFTSGSSSFMTVTTVDNTVVGFGYGPFTLALGADSYRVHLYVDETCTAEDVCLSASVQLLIDQDVDDDSDGYTIAQGDCDDTNAAINPGVSEIPDNDVDENCDGVVEYSAPGNDLCSAATAIACGDTLSGTNVGATDGDGVAGDGCGSNSGSAGVWYIFTGTGDTVTASTCSSADFDTEITVYSGGCGALTCVGNNDDGSGCSGNTSEFEFESVAGTTYYIYVSGWNASSGNFDLSLTCVTNEDADGDGYSIADGDCDDNDSAINPGAEDIPNDGIDQDCDGSDAIDVDEDGYLAEDDCDDTNAAINPGATDIPGNGIDEDCDGSDAFVAPDNDDCTGAIMLTVGTTFEENAMTADYTGATDSGLGGFSCSFSSANQSDVFYSFVATGTNAIVETRVMDGSSMDDSIVSVYSDCPATNVVGCDDDGQDTAYGSLMSILDLTDLTAGTTYYIRVGEYGGNAGEFMISVYSPEDVDGDGYTVADGDCDDNDSAINPGATDIPNDGIDQDCDGSDAIDADGDGFLVEDDCDDTNADINPDAEDIPGNGIDEDCDGADAIAAPDNDECGSATILTVGATFEENAMTADYTGATDSGLGGFSCSFSGANQSDVFYSFIATGTNAIVETRVVDGSSMDDSIVSVYSDCPATNVVDCNDDGQDTAYGNLMSIVDLTDLIVGATYYIRVGEYGGNAGEFMISVYSPEDVDGDGYTVADGDCDDNDSAINPGATDIPNDGIDQDCDGSDAIDADDDGYLVEDDCDDTDASINPGATDIPGNGIDEDCDGADAVAAPDNDDCANATVIACGETINATSEGSIGDQEGSGCFMGSNGIWFTFTGTGGDMTVSVDASFDHEVAISTGVCGDLTNINCDDQSLGTETHTFESVLDATYYVYVAHYSSSSTTTGTIDITLECAEIPECIEPSALTLDSVTSNEAVVSWTNDPSATLGVEYEFGASGFTPGTGSFIAAGGGIGSAATSAETLNPGTDYDFYVRSNCDANGFSSWAGPLSFTTSLSVPDNDLFGDAISVSCGDVVSGTTIGATLDESDAPSVSTVETDTNADVDSPWVWYSFTGTVPGERVTLSTCGTANTDFDTEIFVYTGTSGALTLVDDGYDECGGSSENYAAETSFDSDGSTTYYIAIGGYDSDDVGNFQLSVTCVAPPECAVPTDFGPETETPTVTTFTWAQGGSETSWEFALSQPDATEPEPATIVTEPTANVGHAPGQTLLVWVRAICGDGIFSDWVSVEYTSPSEAPDNDLCADATPIACGDTISGTTTDATFDDVGTCGTSNTASGVWYSFTGIDGEATISTCGTANFDTKLSVFTGVCGDLTCVDGNDDGAGCSGFTSELTIPTTAGVEYFILVHGFSSSTGDFDLTLTCQSLDPCDAEELPQLTWTGTMDTDWENTGNWDNNEAPSLLVFADVTIPMSAPNYPMLTVGQNLYIAECSTVTVESGASLSVGANVEVTNDGIVSNDGTVTFESDATGSAYIGSGMGMFMGDFTVERYIPAKRAYRQLGSPVTTSTPISDNWQQDTHITGPAGNTDGFDVTLTGNPSAYIFDNIAYEYVELANTNATNLIPGTMYHILIRGDRNTDLTNNEATPSETTLHATGELTAENVGSQMIAVNVPEQRFIAVGNPFQSQIDMNTVLTTGSANINPNFYWVWDPTLGTRGAYTAIMAATGTASTVGSDANQYLQAGQAGWVYTAGAGQSSVIFDQSSKNNSGFETSTFNDNGGVNSLSQLRLSLYESSAFANSDTATDGVLILFGANGNNGIDANDALSITNLDENFAISNDSELLSIENRAMPQETEEIQLEINTYRSTNYTIVAEGISIEGATPYLYDNHTGTYTEIPQTGTVNYSYTVDASISSSIAGGRFTIVFFQTTLSTGSFDIDSIKLYPNPTNIGKFYINVPLGMDDLEVTIYDVLGTKLYNEKGFNAGSRITVEAGSKFSMGTYFVELSSKGRTTTKKLIIN